MRYFEDFLPGTNHQLGSRLMESEAIQRFAREFDRLPFHLDPLAAEQSIFGGLIASGLHTLSVAASIVVDDLLLGSSMTGGMGISQLRWLNPVRPGDHISVEVAIVETEVLSKRPRLGRVRMAYTVRNQALATVMVADVDYLFSRREVASPDSASQNGLPPITDKETP